MDLRKLTNKIPFRVFVPLFYALYFVSILAYLLLWPFVLLYGFVVLCPLSWYRWGKNGKDILLVLSSQNSEARDWSARLSLSFNERAVLLDYDAVKDWPRWSVATQLFGIFGPHAIPQEFKRWSLPVAIVVKRNRKPKIFRFGLRVKDREIVLDHLRTELSGESASRH